MLEFHTMATYMFAGKKIYQHKYVNDGVTLYQLTPSPIVNTKMYYLQSTAPINGTVVKAYVNNHMSSKFA